MKIQSVDKIKLLFVEDDRDLAFMIKDGLESLGRYDVYTAYNGLDGYDAYMCFQPDIIVTDVQMPVLNGIEMTKQIRKKDKMIPIIFATGSATVMTGYESDIDFFIKKPFTVAELNAHVQAFFRRRDVFFYNHLSKEVVHIGKYIFHIEKQVLQYENQVYRLTGKGTQILERLYKKRGCLVRRDDLLDELWGKNNYFNSRSLDVFVNSLRKDLALDPNVELRTIRGKGLELIINDNSD